MEPSRPCCCQHVLFVIDAAECRAKTKSAVLRKALRIGPPRDSREQPSFHAVTATLLLSLEMEKINCRRVSYSVVCVAGNSYHGHFFVIVTDKLQNTREEILLPRGGKP